MKEQKFSTLVTKYANEMDKNIPWNEYPRPSMVRGSFLCLNGRWKFAFSNEEFANDFDSEILVPFPPESLLSEIEKQKANDLLLAAQITQLIAECR